MIVRHFLTWIRNASAAERAEATHALARAWLISDLPEDDRIAAEGALLTMLDDSSPLVRQAMSDVFAASTNAPPAIIRALAADQPSIALPVVELSPLLTDADLVDLVATGSPEMQSAIACRLDLSPALAAAIAEVAGAAACLELLENPEAVVPSFSVNRLVERHGHLAPIRECVLARDDLSPQTRLALADKVSEALAQFATGKQWLSAARADEIKAETRERLIADVAARLPADQLGDLVDHLRQKAELTPALVLRALLSGNAEFVRAALVELSGLSRQRVAGLIADRSGVSLTALLQRAGFPASTFVAIRVGLLAVAETPMVSSAEEPARLSRQAVERVLTACEDRSSQSGEPMLILLRRFATEAARDEARLFCETLVAGGIDETSNDHLIADQSAREDEAASETFVSAEPVEVAFSLEESAQAETVPIDAVALDVMQDEFVEDDFVNDEFPQEHFEHDDHDNDEFVLDELAFERSLRAA